MKDIYMVFLLNEENIFETAQIASIQKILEEAHPRQKVTSLIGTFINDEPHGYLCGGVTEGRSLLPMLDIEAMLIVVPEEFKLLQDNSTLEISAIAQINPDEHIIIVQQEKSDQEYFKVSLVSDVFKIQKYVEKGFQYVSSMTENSSEFLAKEILAHC